MQSIRNRLALCAFVGAAAIPAHATDVALSTQSGQSGYGQWAEFTVDSYAAPSYGLGWIDSDNGSALNYTFQISAGSVGSLTVVDAGIAGDTYSITNHGNPFGATAAVPVGSYEASADLGTDFDAALLNPAFSHGTFLLGAGTYSISGALGQSVTLGGEALNATVGAVRLTVTSAVPEPSTTALAIAGLGVITAAIRRRRD